MCNDSTNQAIEKAYMQHSQACFQLQEHLRHAYVAMPMNSDANDVAIADLEADDPLEEEFNVPVVGEGSAEMTKLTKSKKLHGKFGCNRTHNEQLIIVPCGMILTHEMFYGVEGVTSVVVRQMLHSQLETNYEWIGDD
jgi:hypothetical protein